mmetsp:Transcript_56919/g.180100  ORF Transcript_56919/g.180100 Transcript_56919/m.180100 type:complete len:304 (-) Transcript_56919:1701-2612(-)
MALMRRLSTCACAPRSCSRPRAPRQSSASNCLVTPPPPTSARSAATVAAHCCGPAATQRRAMHCEVEYPACLLALLVVARPAAIRLSRRASKLAAPPTGEATRRLKKDSRAPRALPCSPGLCTSSRAWGSTTPATVPAHSGRAVSMLLMSRSAREATCRSASVTSAAASVTTASRAPGAAAPRPVRTRLSRASREERRSARLDLRRKPVSSPTAASATGERSSARGESEAVRRALTAARRVISLRRRSSSMGRHVGSCEASSSPRVASISPIHVMAHSFTSWSWSCALRRESTPVYMAAAAGL